MNSFLIEDYIQEEIDQAYEEEKLYLENTSTIRKTFYLRDNLQIPLVKPVLANKIKRDSIFEFTGAFIDANERQLMAPGPLENFVFSDKEIDFLYGLFNLNRETLFSMITNMFEVAYDGSVKYHRDKSLASEVPHKILITSIIIQALQNNDDELLNAGALLIGFSEYPIIFRKIFKFVDKEIMLYTLSHLKNRFKIRSKNLTTVLAQIRYDAESSIDARKKELLIGMDIEYINFLNRVRGQMISPLKNIAKLYFQNHEDKKTQHTQISKHDDGTLADQAGYTHIMSSIIENTYSKFISNPIYSPIVNIITDRVDSDGNKKSVLDKNKFITYINQVFTTKNNKLFKFIENIITVYFQEYPSSTSINTGEFVNFGLGLYKRISTSKKPLFQEIRSILDFWMFDVINIKEYTQNAGTIINYTKAIFDYMILMIKYHN